MKKLLITEEERSRILGMHKTAIKKESLNENKLSTDDFLDLVKKNLTNESFSKLKSLLTEADLVVATLPNVDKAGLRAVPGFVNAESVTKQWIADRKIPFTVEEPAFWLTLQQLNRYVFSQASDAWPKKGYNPKILQKTAKDINRQDLVAGVQYTLNGNTELEIQLNEHPEQKGKVLTNGLVSVEGFQPGDQAAASDINAIATYCNDYNLKATVANPASPVINLEPYKLTKAGITGGSFVEGNPKTTAGAGALDIAESVYTSGAILYATSTYKAASAQTTGVAKTDIKFIPGPELEAILPPQLFPTLEIKIASGMEKYIDEAIAAARAAAGEGGQITGVRIESSASFDSPVNLDQAGFAKRLGLDVTKVPKNPKVDQQGEVKDPMSGGNAFLAYNRGLALKNALGDKAGVAPTIKAVVQPGKEAAQYAKIFFLVKKRDNSTEVTDKDIQSIGQATKSTDLGGLFKLNKYDLL
jgi:hypothetical protein